MTRKIRRVTVYFKSKSDKRKKYKTELHGDGKITCFCPGYVYNQNCWHIKRVANYPFVKKQLAK